MEYLVGTGLALGVSIFASLSGMDRERSFYAVVLAVIASYYVLFAAMADALGALGHELIPLTLFLALVVLGFRRSPWFLVAGLAAHGVFDLIHARLVTNPGVPAWWPGFCLGYDVAAAGYLALLLVRRGHRASGTTSPERAEVR